MPTWQPDLAPLTARIPRLYHLLRALGDARHSDLGVTASMCEVMAALTDGGPRTVPDLARAKPVSRQHMQSVVNELLAAGLAEAQANPSHRRSSLIALTDEGRRHYRLVHEREAELLARTAPAVSHADLAAAQRLFDLLERDLAAQQAAVERGET